MDKPRVVITGSSGFLGQNLVPRLIGHYEVYEVCRDLSRFSGLPNSNVIHWRGDIREMGREISAISPRAIVHMAAHFSAQAKADEMPGMIDASVALSLGLLEGVEDENCQLVSIGTRFQRLDKGRAISLYGALKNCQEELFALYAREPKQLTFLEMGDVYGPGDRRRKLIETLVSRARDGQPVVLRHPSSLMYPVYVSDAVAAVLAAVQGQTGVHGQFSVVGPEGATTVKEVAHAFGRSLSWRVDQSPEEPLETKWSNEFMDDESVQFQWLPGWQPRVGLEEGISLVLRAAGLRTHE